MKLAILVTCLGLSTLLPITDAFGDHFCSQTNADKSKKFIIIDNQGRNCPRGYTYAGSATVLTATQMKSLITSQATALFTTLIKQSPEVKGAQGPKGDAGQPGPVGPAGPSGASAGCASEGYAESGKVFGVAYGYNDEGSGNDFYVCCRLKKLIYFGSGGRGYSGYRCDENGNLGTKAVGVALPR